jgi:tight adherence protein B
MNRKIQVEMEMEQAVAGRQMEKNIMFVMPFFIVLYLRITNPDYMDILFSSMTGHLIMLTCLILLWIGDKWAEHIVNINF